MIKKYPDFWSILIGPGPIGIFLGFLVIAYIAGAVSLLIEASNRDIESVHTPKKFSWEFLFKANFKRILANFLAVPLLIRLSYQYLNPEFMIATSIGIGVIIDRAAMKLKNIGLLSNEKMAQKVMEKINGAN